MSQMLVVKARGLFTAPNDLSAVPDGGLLQADNIVIDKDGLIEPRRGFSRLLAFSDASYRAWAYSTYQDKIMCRYTGGHVAYLGSSNGSPAWIPLSGTYNNPDNDYGHSRFLKTNSNLYFTSSSGIYRMDAYNSTPVLAGVARGLDSEVSLNSASGGFLATANQIAYRVVWGFKDANKNIHYGSPSGRSVVVNSSGVGKDVDHTIPIPSGITTSHFVQVYRTKASGDVAVEPDEEFGLVYEANPTGTNITNKYLTFTDKTTDDLRGETLYTSPSIEGITMSNERPPIAWDIEDFFGSTVYANVTSKQRLTITLLSTEDLSTSTTDTLTIAGVTYTADTTETIATGHFKVSKVAGGGTPAQNITDTARSLVRVINRYASNTAVYAYYMSAPGDLPGQILLEERNIGGSVFTAVASAHGTVFNPSLTSAQSSSSDALQNYIMFSKTDLAEAVPLVYLKPVGSSGNKILRIKRLRNTLFIFKEKEGIYRMTGNSPDTFATELFDSSAKLIAPDSVAVVNNEIWCQCDQGVTVVTETGVEVVSRPIEDLILDVYGTAIDQVKKYSWGLAYETDRKYILFTVQASSDTYATQAFVFNTFTRTWTRWDISGTAGFVSDVDDKAYICDGASYYTLQERKSKNYTDYVDYSFSATISSVSGTSVYMSDTTGIEVGDLIYQSASLVSPVVSVDVAGVVVEDALSFTAGACTVYKSYSCEMQYSGIHGQPGTAKQFPEVSFMFDGATFYSGYAEFASDISNGFEQIQILGNRNGLWGLFPWGMAPWGGASTSVPIRVYVPLEKQRCSELKIKFKIRQGYAHFKLQGISVIIRETGSFVIAK